MLAVNSRAKGIFGVLQCYMQKQVSQVLHHQSRVTVV